jgi:hypothetical protein
MLMSFQLPTVVIGNVSGVPFFLALLICGGYALYIRIFLQRYHQLDYRILYPSQIFWGCHGRTCGLSTTIASIVCFRSCSSRTLAPSNETAKGTSLNSTRILCFVPFFARSVGFGPIAPPPSRALLSLQAPRKRKEREERDGGFLIT